MAKRKVEDTTADNWMDQWREKWPREFQVRAWERGWNVFDGVVRREVSVSRYKDDFSALQGVRSEAKKGSAIAKLALSIHEATNKELLLEP